MSVGKNLMDEGFTDEAIEAIQKEVALANNAEFY